MNAASAHQATDFDCHGKIGDEQQKSDRMKKKKRGEREQKNMIRFSDIIIYNMMNYELGSHGET